MGKYLRLYLHFLRFSFAKATAYRFDFWCRILMDTSYYLVQIGFFQIIFLRTSLLGGWNDSQIMIFLGAHFVLDALQMTFLSTNLWEFPSIVNQGDLDFYLVKPVNSLFFLCFREVAINSFVNLAMAIAFLVRAIHRYQEPFTWMNVASFSLFLLIGFFLYFGLRFLISLPVLWSSSPYSLERVFYAAIPLMERPDTLFRGPVRFIILTLIPFGLMVSLPSRIFFEGFSFYWLLHAVIVLIFLWSVVLFVWRRGLMNYSPASS